MASIGLGKSTGSMGEKLFDLLSCDPMVSLIWFLSKVDSFFSRRLMSKTTSLDVRMFVR